MQQFLHCFVNGCIFTDHKVHLEVATLSESFLCIVYLTERCSHGMMLLSPCLQHGQKSSKPWEFSQRANTSGGRRDASSSVLYVVMQLLIKASLIQRRNIHQEQETWQMRKLLTLFEIWVIISVLLGKWNLWYNSQFHFGGWRWDTLVDYHLRLTKIDYNSITSDFSTSHSQVDSQPLVFRSIYQERSNCEHLRIPMLKLCWFSWKPSTMIIHNIS